jgi:hypothetical protein
MRQYQKRHRMIEISDYPLEKYAFAPQRRGKVPDEPNTKFESDLFRALKSHLEHVSALRPQYVQVVQQFLNNKQYTDIFHEPTQKQVFRGMAVTSQWLGNAINLDPYEIDNVNIEIDDEGFPDSGSESAKFTFRPKNEGTGSSWTTDVQTAIDFGLGNIKSEKPWGIIMVANVADNENRFVECENGIYDVEELDVYDTENEVIALGDVKVSKLYWSLTRSSMYRVMGL